jgi:hypothetical protein
MVASQGGVNMGERLPTRRLLVVLTVVLLLAGCASGQSPSPTAVPIASAGIAGWVWSEASEADVALVDGTLRAVSTDDIEVLDDRYASNATLMTSWDPTPCDRECILGIPSATPNTYVRVGGPYTVSYNGSEYKLPAGSRYVFFTMVIHTDIFDCWFEVNAEGKIVNQWVGWKKV